MFEVLGSVRSKKIVGSRRSSRKTIGVRAVIGDLPHRSWKWYLSCIFQALGIVHLTAAESQLGLPLSRAFCDHRTIKEVCWSCIPWDHRTIRAIRRKAISRHGSPWVMTSDETVEKWRRAFSQLLRGDERAVAIGGCLRVKFGGPIAFAGSASAGIFSIGEKL